MRARIVERMLIPVTPKGLRELADRLQAKWDRAKLGDDVPSEVHPITPELELVFQIDQEDMHQQAYLEKINRVNNGK